MKITIQHPLASDDDLVQKAHMLHINDLTYRIAGRTLFDATNLIVPATGKVGLVGRNGSGKSTLFKLITGDLAPESGSIKLSRGLKIGQVAQEAPGTEISLLDFVLAADLERTALLSEAETATDPNRIAEIQLRLTDIGSHSAEARAGAILDGLGFDNVAQKKSCSSFSGGWRMRVALAAVLFTEPDLLMLDEPTNYLDLEGTLWLENYIARYNRAVIIISHDRDLLNKAVGQIAHLDQLKITLYRGGYDQFEKLRLEKMVLQQKHIKKQEERRKHLESFIIRFKAKASKAKQAQSRVKALQRMSPITALVDDRMLPIHFNNPARQAAPPIIKLENVQAGYGDSVVLKNLTMRVDPDDRIALLGANGNGKSTFAKLISRRLEPMDGSITWSDKLQIAYFAQHQLDELNPAESAVAHIRDHYPDEPENKIRARVSRMGLGTEKMDTPVRDLSGGEKARLLLGIVTQKGPHLLILDEPTNHLDIDSREALIEAINAYEGAVLLISHDRHLVEACVDRLWIVADGGVRPYDDDLEAYRKYILTAGKANKNSVSNSSSTKKSGQDRRRLAAEKRSLLAPLRKKIKSCEQDMEKQRKLIARLDVDLAKPALFADDPDEGTRLSKKRADALKAIDKIEELWLELSEEYEIATTDKNQNGTGKAC